MKVSSTALRSIVETADIAMPVTGVLLEIRTDGRLLVDLGRSRACVCDWLETGSSVELVPGDRLLIVSPCSGEAPIAVGRVGRYRHCQTEASVTLEASESLTLKCGQSSLEMRADGKVMVKGEDVLLRAKGTQRIRAGTVAIN